MKENIINKQNEETSWYTKRDICGKVMTIKQIVDGINSNIKCGKLIGRDRVERTIKKLFPTKMKRGETTYLTEQEATLLLDVLQKNPKSLEQTSAAAAEVLKSTSTNLSPALKMKQAFDLMNEAYQEEITRLKQQNIEVVEENGVLKLENKQLVEENNYLKKLTDFQSTQIGYYTKKYHSWYDDYENY